MEIRFSEFKRKSDGFIASFSPIEYTLNANDAICTELDIFTITDSEIKRCIIEPVMQIVKNIDTFDLVISFGERTDDDTVVEKARLHLTEFGLDLDADPDLDDRTTSALRHIASDVSMYGFELIDAFNSKTAGTPISKTLKDLADTDTTECLDKMTTADSANIDDIIAEVQKRTQADIIKPKETLADYVCDNLLKEELLEVKDFIEKEAMYKACGVDTPKGILLKGAPGTGKTYAARCIAGEVDCLFMVCTASSLQGQYIGSGAQNVKDLFKGAKLLCEKSGKGVIVFIDELDSFGDRATHNGSSSGEENRTINQLLAELSGFEDTDGIMVIGATNYPDRIDDALMRAGRFSRQITIRKPELLERQHLVEYYFKKIKKPLDGADYGMIAELVKGLTPADIKEIANESAILSIRYSQDKITIDNVNEAVNKVITKNIRTPDGRLDAHLVAAHEAGHVYAEYLYNNNIAIKVTNYSYGDAGGFTQPSEYLEGLFTAERMLNEVRVLLAGRVAERLVCGYVTNGASNDFEKCKRILTSYYTDYHFEPYEVDKIKQIVQDKLVALYNETYTELEYPHNLNKIIKITEELDKNRVLYSTDLSAILITGGLTL